MFWTLHKILGIPWVSYSQNTFCFKVLFWPYSLMQLAPVGSGSAVTTVLGQETRAKEEQFTWALWRLEALPYCSFAGHPAGSTSGTNAGRQKASQRMVWKQCSLVAITSDSKWQRNRDFMALFSLVITGQTSFSNVHEQLSSHRPLLITMNCPKFSF